METTVQNVYSLFSIFIIPCNCIVIVSHKMIIFKAEDLIFLTLDSSDLKRFRSSLQSHSW